MIKNSPAPKSKSTELNSEWNHAVAGAARGLSGGSALKVLIADDNSVSRLLLERLLSKWGYEVIQANDGAQAWEVLQTEDPPRLVILDWMMPGMSGPEVCLRSTQTRGLRLCVHSAGHVERR